MQGRAVGGSCPAGPLMPYAAYHIAGSGFCAPLFRGTASDKFFLQVLEFLGSFLGCRSGGVYLCLFSGYLLRQFSHDLAFECFAGLLDLEQIQLVLRELLYLPCLRQLGACRLEAALPVFSGTRFTLGMIRTLGLKLF